MPKKILYILFFLLRGAGSMLSQDVPFPDNEAVWKEEHITIAGPVLKYFSLCGDTVVGGNTYIQVFQLQVDNALNITGETYLGGLRTGGKIVRYLPAWASMEYVLYDFSLEQGDSIDLLPISGIEPVTREVDSVKVETIGGRLRKVIYFHPAPSELFPEYWMEGAGSSYGLLGRATPPGGDLGFSLLCFRHENDFVNLTPTDCLLPELTGCTIINANAEISTELPKLSVAPNPGGGAIRFFVHLKERMEDAALKIYAANGKLLSMSDEVMPDMPLPGQVPLTPGFYIAVLESKKTGRTLAHCTFIWE